MVSPIFFIISFYIQQYGYPSSVLLFLVSFYKSSPYMPKSLKVKLNSSGFLYTIVTAPTSSLMHSFPFFFCLVFPLTQCNILVSVKWSLFSSVYYYPTLDSILHYRSYSCAVKFSLQLEWYLLVMHNNRVTSFHPPYLESYGLHYPFFLSFLHDELKILV